MADKEIFTVRFEPVGVEMEVEEGEIVLEAAFRQGIALMHGCKEGQCSSCKAVLIDGDIELLKHSTFALPDYEREDDHVLLCRTEAYSDLEVELLTYDDELLVGALAVKEVDATVTLNESLTHDIRRLVVSVSEEFPFRAGHYVDITIPGTGITRSYSMGDRPTDEKKLEFIIKLYSDGAFSSQLRDQIKEGSSLQIKGPFGSCFRREKREGPMVLVAGGSGMAPVWAILNDHLAHGDIRRPVTFFYGARTEKDLFYLDKIEEITNRLPKPNFTFVPGLSDTEDDSNWTGETGFIHTVVDSYFKDEKLKGKDIEVYVCGPPPMIDALMPVLRMNRIDDEFIHVDKFTQAPVSRVAD